MCLSTQEHKTTPTPNLNQQAKETIKPHMHAHSSCVFKHRTNNTPSVTCLSYFPHLIHLKILF